MLPEKERRKPTNDWSLMKRLFPYIKNYRFLVVLSLLLMIGFNTAGVIQPYIFKTGIDNDVARGDIRGLWNTALIFFIIMLSGFIFNVLFNYSIQYLGQRLLFDIRLDLYKHMLRLSKVYYDRTPVGKTLTNITSDVEAIRQFISEGIVLVLGDLLKVFLILIAMLLVNPKLALLVFITLPFFAAVTIFFRKSIRTGYQGIRRANAEMNTSLVETITGIREIIQFNYQNQSRNNFDRSNRNYLNAFLKVVHAYSLYFPTLEIVSNCSLIIILLYSHSALGINLQVGEIFAFFTYINMFFRPLRQLAEKFNMFQSAMAAAERIFRLFDRKIKIKDGSVRRRKDGLKAGKIVFDRVNFSYSQDTPVLRDVSFVIKPGENIALVGYTGSGKTTVANLINRLYDVTSGSIFIDDVRINDYNLYDLRKQISTVSQDPFLFKGTVTENISLNDPSIPPEKIVPSTQAVYADQFINRFPSKYDENVLEEGKRLSTGQRQLISYARAIVREPSILILDEATSNIDSETEKQIEAATRNIIKNRTSIIIAHRLSTIRMVDRIFVLHRGKLVEEGNHTELLKKRGIYYKLMQTQAFMSK